MKVIDDGVIKYDRSNFSHSGPLEIVEYSDLELWREKLFALNLIGEYKNEGVGFGNMSEVKNCSQFYNSVLPQFVITGTQTGKYPKLDGRHYTRVLDYNIDQLKLTAMGPLEASSEALTHAAIYSFNKKIKAVIHVHSSKIWKGMIEDKADFTSNNIPYGTIEMAKATQDCIAGKDFGSFCMHGHEDGIVSYGRSLEEAGNLILELFNKYE